MWQLLLITFHAPFNRLNFIMLVLCLLHLQLRKLKHRVIRKYILLSVVGEPGVISLTQCLQKTQKGKRNIIRGESLPWIEWNKSLRCTGLELRWLILFSALIPSLKSLWQTQLMEQTKWLTAGSWFLTLNSWGPFLRFMFLYISICCHAQWVCFRVTSSALQCYP